MKVSPGAGCCGRSPSQASNTSSKTAWSAHGQATRLAGMDVPQGVGGETCKRPFTSGAKYNRNLWNLPLIGRGRRSCANAGTGDLCQQPCGQQNVTNVALQGEGGEFAPILPAEELEALYDRIVADELVVVDGGGSVMNADGTPVSGRAAATPQQGRAPLNARLAAALGLTQLLLPFRLAPSLRVDFVEAAGETGRQHRRDDL
jgi:hypothetical protein